MTFMFRSLTVAAAFALIAAPVRLAAQDPGTFQVTSTTFHRDSFLPLSMIDNIPGNGVNTCSINGAPGGDQSPELSWTQPSPGTRSFVVVLFDVTASFTHWGMYNISGSARGLPQNAGVPNSQFGQEILNDFEAGQEYDGPCPPANIAPFVHTYVFTVYALDEELTLPSSANFPANAETLYQALIKAGSEGHVLDKASIAGFYSTTK